MDVAGAIILNGYAYKVESPSGRSHMKDSRRRNVTRLLKHTHDFRTCELYLTPCIQLG